MSGIDELLQRNQPQTQAVLNLLLESPYFYRTDSPADFAFLRQRRDEFEDFFDSHFGWQLIIDRECARLYKRKNYNRRITDSVRTFFRLSGRDETIAFLVLVEYFEHLVAELNYDVEKELPRFVFGDFLEYSVSRFHELFPGDERYTDDYIRKRLKPLFRKLEQFRFITLIDDAERSGHGDQDIYQMLPALYHYDAAQLAQPIDAADDSVEEDAWSE